MKKFFILLVFLFYPNIGHAYIDPNLFTIIWQFLAAFLFSMIAYSRFLYVQSITYFRKFESFFSKLQNFYIIEIFAVLSSILIPILFVLSRDDNIFEQEIILNTIIIQFFILLLIFFLNYSVIKNIKKSLIFSCTFFLIIQFYGFLEGLIIISFFNVETLKYFRVLSLALIIISSFLFITNHKKINHKKYLRFLMIFLSTFFLIVIFNNLKNLNITYYEEDVWGYESPEISKINYHQNIYLILADSYVSPTYFNKLYSSKNILYDYLKKNDFMVKPNSFSNYSTTVLSLPSFFNSNYYKEINKKSLKNPYKRIENSYLFKTLKENKYSNNSYKCHYAYFDKEQFCKELIKLKQNDQDLNLIETIYYYNSIHSAFLHLKKFLKLRFNKNTNSNKKTIKIDLDNLIHSNKKKSFNTIIFTIPHAPYVVKENCKFRKAIPKNELTVNNALIEDHDTRINGYYGNIQCVNTHIIHAIKKIKKEDNTALIILISDNGPMLRPKKLNHNDNKKLSSLDKLALDHNSSIFAVGGNFKCKEMLSSMSLINTFRIILNCNSSKDDPLLPKKVYVSSPGETLDTRLYHNDK